MNQSKNKLAGVDYIPLVILAITSVVLIGLQLKPVGWWLLVSGLILTAMTTKKDLRVHVIIAYISIGLLGLAPISTDISNDNMMRMGLVLFLALAVPLVLTRFVLKDKTIRFPWRHGRRWFKSEVSYILITASIAYLLLPFYLQSTGAYLNWYVEDNAESIFRLFLGTNALGIWDELFFVSTILALLRKHLSFVQANLLQAVMFTAFLFELGFTGWAPLVLYPFALTQGYIFKKTESLFYVVTIHLTLDFVLFLALLNAHHPHLADVFIT